MISYFYSIALTPYFAIRPFLSLLITALVVYFSGISFGPAWLIHGSILLLLVGLAVMEFIAVRNPDTKYLVTQFGGVINPVATVLVILPSMNEDTRVLLSLFAYDVSILDVMLGYIWTGIAAFAVWYITLIRNGAMYILEQLDEDDDLGLQQVLSWSEEGWVIAGVVITFAIPILAMGMFVMTLLGIFLAKKYAERVEQKSQVPCPTCQQPIHASAITCSECRHPNPSPFQVGWLGQAKVNQLVTDLNAHRLQLVGRKRCPECATRLKEKRIHQPCPTCFTETFANAQQVEVYLANLNQQLPRIMMMSFILGFIPVLGIIPGIIYYRFTLIASLRGYVPRATGCLTRWGVRMMNLFLISFQPVPPIGFFILPLMCLINFKIYEGIIRRESKKTFGGGGGYSHRETPVAQP